MNDATHPKHNTLTNRKTKTMKPTPLNEESLNKIVGGSSYINDLQKFIALGTSRSPSFSVLYHKEGDAASKMTHVNCAVSDLGFRKLINLAESSGKIALIAANGSRTEFTADQLRQML